VFILNVCIDYRDLCGTKIKREGEKSNAREICERETNVRYRYERDEK
jgi:hypothetical protein